MPDTIPGIVIAAPASNSGKTVITLALLRALTRNGHTVAAAKTGPDYIDPAFQAAACRDTCINLDPWAMTPDQIKGLATDHVKGKAFLMCEGVMGLFDGAANGDGSTADLAALAGWPIVLVVDVKGQSASAAAVISGFAKFRDDINVAGVILNRVGSDRHKQMIVDACAKHLPDLPVLGAVRRSEDLILPERHLGLVQAGEHSELDAFLDRAADIISEDVDLDALIALINQKAGKTKKAGKSGESAKAEQSAPLIAPLGSYIAVARDAAFAFSYPHLLDGWRASGARISFFSPLADEAPNPDCDAIYLPGGYPELHAKTLAAAKAFKAGMRDAAQKGVLIYGECGGYMTLGKGLVDASGTRHEMLGLLPLETSFASRRLHLGYREAQLGIPTPFGPAGMKLRGHEFHYATTLSEDGMPFCRMKTATGLDLGPAGLVEGRIFGSFFHMIAQS
ncbi:cobyrinate a,c-diamide synthase [Thalassospira sp.]|uniref:cobyrinate a,c-diamide synthase n=1 Tax=Thalassospira sp. TaxID=1912094 RepID=UPI000C6C0768|nr:cobyrinate a,c-diamide synthase [Thalassospira sp.]MBC04733.1 cobyrinic acid a,c-diamide synthase [Thalassospira sp.]|tara:strand:- start:14731 stop:16083 length:1353 start_codon:yes stop_codon:yes gene_type:complete